MSQNYFTPRPSTKESIRSIWIVSGNPRLIRADIGPRPARTPMPNVGTGAAIRVPTANIGLRTGGVQRPRKRPFGVRVCVDNHCITVPSMLFSASTEVNFELGP
jgi:hypothetical protein